MEGRQPRAPHRSSSSSCAPRAGATDTGGKLQHSKRRSLTRRRSRRRLLRRPRALRVTVQKTHQRSTGGRNLWRKRQHPYRQELKQHFRRHYQQAELAQLSSSMKRRKKLQQRNSPGLHLYQRPCRAKHGRKQKMSKTQLPHRLPLCAETRLPHDHKGQDR